MKLEKIIWVVIVLQFFFAGQMNAQGNLGQSGVNFLQIGVDPRITGLGGAGVALVGGAAALYWNPAGAVQAENIDINFSYTNWFLDTKLAYGAIVKNAGRLGTFGLSVLSFYMDDMEITSVYESEGTGEFYSAGDIAIGLSYARSLTDRFTFGITGKYVREHIWNESADQIALDVGSAYRTDFYNLRLGIAIRNISGKLQFSGADIDRRIAEEQELEIPDNPRIERLSPQFRMPQIFHLGLAFDPIKTETSVITLLTDVETPNDNQERVIVGMEYSLKQFAFLRGAYRMNYDAGDLAFGAGLNMKLSGVQTRLDYSFSTYGILGDVHRLGFGISL